MTERLERAVEDVAHSLQHLAHSNATCFDVAQHTVHALRARGISAQPAGARGHSFVEVAPDWIVDLWEKDGTIRAKLWKRGHIPQDQEPEAYEREECEHDEHDHGICLDCGKDIFDDLVASAEFARDCREDR